MAEQRKGKRDSKADTTPMDKEDKVKPTLADINAAKNRASLVTFFMPAVLFIYLGLVLSKYNLKEFNHLLTNKYLLLGFKDLHTLKDALVTNLVDSSVWGLTYLYVRRFMNPEFREGTHKYIQDGYFGALATFCTTLAKQIIKNFNK